MLKRIEKGNLLTDELADVKRRRNSIVSCIKVLNIDVEKYSFEAEEKQDTTLLSKGNALRKSISEKQELRMFYITC